MALNSANETSRKIYLSMAHGKIVHSTKNGDKEYFSSVEGTLLDIYKKNRNFNGVTEPFWYIDLKDGEEVYSLSLQYASGVFKSIINSLASAELLTLESPVRIEPYEKGNFTKVVVYSEGVKLDWLTKEMPPVKEITLPDGTTYKDDRERMNFIEGLVLKVKEKLAPKPQPQPRSRGLKK